MLLDVILIALVITVFDLSLLQEMAAIVVIAITVTLLAVE